MKLSIKTVIPGIFALSALGFTGFLVWAAHSSFGAISDFPEYYAAARLVLSGQGAGTYDIQALGTAQHTLFPSLGSRVIPIFVPPAGLPWIVPIGFLPVEVAPLIWKILALASLFASALLLGKAFKLPLSGLLWLMAGIGLSGATYEAMRIDQLAPFLLFALSFAIWAIVEKRDALAALGLSVLFLKPQLLMPITVFLVGARRSKLVGMMLVIAFVLAGVAYAELGASGFSNYAHLVGPTVENDQYMQPELMATLRGQLLRFFPTAKSLAMYISTSVFLIFQVLVLFAGVKSAKNPRWLEIGILLAMPLGMFTSLHCHDYDLLLLAPALVVLFTEYWQDQMPPWVVLGVMFGGLSFMLPFSIYIHYDYLMKGGIFNPFAWLLLAFSIVTAVLALKNIPAPITIADVSSDMNTQKSSDLLGDGTSGLS